MTLYNRALFSIALLIGSAGIVEAQDAGRVVTACSTRSYTVGTNQPITIDPNGDMCVEASPSGVQDVIVLPTDDVDAAIVPVKSSAVETGHVIKSSAGNLYGFSVTTGAVAGYAMVHNSATVPAAGAVTPVKCEPVAADTGISFAFDPPIRLSIGISISFSSTGCFTQTNSATAFISAQAE